jgi:DNA repair protein RadC
MADGDNVHSGHRQRLRQRFVEEGGLDSFQYHEIIELLLFYAIPRRDTNELAHRLIDSFGSFHNLLNATPEEISDCCNVSENTAVLISMLPHIAKRYMTSVWDETGKVIASKSDAFEIFKPIALGEQRERFYLACLDKSYRLIRVVKLTEGDTNGTMVYIDKIIEVVLRYKAAFAIIAHNHPGRTMKPSAEDIAATNEIKKALDIVNVRLVDHIIVCGDKCYSFAQNSLCHLKY